MPQTVKDMLELVVGTGVGASFIVFVWQSRRAQKLEDQRQLARARVLLMRLINLTPNDPFTAITGGDPHVVAHALGEWKQEIADTRTELENTALTIRSRKLRPIAAKLLAVAEPPLGAWDDDLAEFLVGQIKVILGPKVVEVRKDAHALTK